MAGLEHRYLPLMGSIKLCTVKQVKNAAKRHMTWWHSWKMGTYVKSDETLFPKWADDWKASYLIGIKASTQKVTAVI